MAVKSIRSRGRGERNLRKKKRERGWGEKASGSLTDSSGKIPYLELFFRPTAVSSAGPLKRLLLRSRHPLAERRDGKNEKQGQKAKVDSQNDATPERDPRIPLR